MPGGFPFLAAGPAAAVSLPGLAPAIAPAPPSAEEMDGRRLRAIALRCANEGELGVFVENVPSDRLRALFESLAEYVGLKHRADWAGEHLLPLLAAKFAKMLVAGKTTARGALALSAHRCASAARRRHWRRACPLSSLG